MIWTAGTLLDYVQELIGEPVGGFYNIATRLAQLNAFQRELVEETRALTDEARFDLVAGEANMPVPAGFLTFDPQAPYLLEGGAYRGNVQVKPMSYLDTSYPGWAASTDLGYPRYLALRGDVLAVYPRPQAGLELVLPYVPVPDDMRDRDDLPFNGNERLNRFAPALAYVVASTHYLPRNMSAANYMQELYQRELRAMRSTVRSSPQYQPRVRVTPRR